MYVSEEGDAYWGGATVNSDTASGYFYNDNLTTDDATMGKTMRVVPNGTSLVLMIKPTFYWDAQGAGVTIAYYRIQASYDNGATWADVTGQRTISSSSGQISGSKEEGITQIGHSGFPAKRPILYRALARKTNNTATAELHIQFNTQ